MRSVIGLAAGLVLEREHLLLDVGDEHEEVHQLRNFTRHAQTFRSPRPADHGGHGRLGAARQRRQHGSVHLRRLKHLRPFTGWPQWFESGTPPNDMIFGRLLQPQVPHIYSKREIVDLLTAARRLGPMPGLRGRQ